MQSREDTRHDLLLIIITALFILFATGFVGPTRLSNEETVVPVV